MVYGKKCSVVGIAFLLLAVGTVFGDDAAAPRPRSMMIAAAAQRQFQSDQPNAALLRNPEGRITNIYGPALTLGQTPTQSASMLVDQSAALLGVDRADLLNLSILADARPTQQLVYDPQMGTYKFTLVYYTQHKDGIPVFRADLRVLTRNEPGYPTVLAKSALRELGGFAVHAGYQKNLISQKALHDAARAATPGMTGFSNPRLVVWAGMDDLPAQPALAYEFEADNGMYATAQYQKELFLIDALTGKLLYRENRIVDVDVTGNVSAPVSPNYAADACGVEASAPLPYARVRTSGGIEAFANVSGNYTLSGVPAGAVTVISGMDGRFFSVFDQAQTTESISQAGTAPGVQNFIHNAANTSEFTRSEVNTYVAANQVRDYLLTYNPSYPVIANQLAFPINVNLNSTCNAFYDFASINFYRAGGGCNNTGFGTVAHHEYGHHIVTSGGSGQGAYGEGMGDVMGVLVTDQSLLAVGFQSCSGGLRDANNTCQYVAGGCSSCGSEAHDCGRLISGCVWTVRNNLLASDPGTYRQILSSIAINAVPLHQGTVIDTGVTLDYLTLDDDDADVFNGTPHRTQINGGFTAHNLPGPELRRIAFVYPSGRPTNINPAGGVAFRVEVVGFTGTPLDNTGRLLYSTGGAYTNVAMTRVSANTYDAVFPAFPCGTTVSYYISAQAAGAPPVAVTDPFLAPSAVYTLDSFVSANVAYAYDFETDQGWQAGIAGDTAATGQWVRGDPIGTGAQPEDDHTASGVNCFFTGQGTAGGGLGQADIDGGTTTLLSPTFTLADQEASRISYWRWYSNDQGAEPNADVFTVQISNNNGGTWTTAETVGPGGPDTEGGWIHHQFVVQTLLPATAQMKIRFVAADLAGGSLVEAAVDDVEVRNFVCTATTCPADFNGDHFVNSQDFFEFLTAFFSGNADFNNSGTTDSQDFFDYVAAFFTPC